MIDRKHNYKLDNFCDKFKIKNIDLAKIMKVSTETITRWRTGHTVITSDKLEEITSCYLKHIEKLLQDIRIFIQKNL